MKKIVVWKDGTWKVDEQTWEYENDSNWLVTIPLNAETLSTEKERAAAPELLDAAKLVRHRDGRGPKALDASRRNLVRGAAMSKNTHLDAAAPELLHELKLANQIIINALNVMTPEQKSAWDELNTRDDLKDGWAVTRNGAREAIIAKAEGRED